MVAVNSGPILNVAFEPKKWMCCTQATKKKSFVCARDIFTLRIRRSESSFEPYLYTRPAQHAICIWCGVDTDTARVFRPLFAFDWLRRCDSIDKFLVSFALIQSAWWWWCVWTVKRRTASLVGLYTRICRVYRWGIYICIVHLDLERRLSFICRHTIHILCTGRYPASIRIWVLNAWAEPEANKSYPTAPFMPHRHQIIISHSIWAWAQYLGPGVSRTK